jgi:hypothetical protein
MLCWASRVVIGREKGVLVSAVLWSVFSLASGLRGAVSLRGGGGRASIAMIEGDDGDDW